MFNTWNLSFIGGYMQKLLIAVMVTGLFVMGGVFVVSLIVSQQNRVVSVQPPTANNINIKVDRNSPTIQTPVIVNPPRPRWNFGVWWGRPNVDINIQRNINVDKNVDVNKNIDINKDVDKDKNVDRDKDINRDRDVDKDRNVNKGR
jgi:hypothetical protein